MSREKDSSKEVVTAGKPDYAIMAISAEEIGDVLRENMSDGLSPLDLDRIKVPAGGGISWEVPTMEGPESVKDLEGVVIYWKECRSFWQDKFTGAGTPPDCYSDDAKVGYGNPGGLCKTCPMAQYGTAKGDNGEPGTGQACKQMRLLFLLQKDSILPAVIVIPPSSLKIVKQYFLRLASKAIPYYGVVSRFSLVKAKSSGGITYSQVEAGIVTTLSRDQAGAMRAISESMRGVLNNVRSTPEDVTE